MNNRFKRGGVSMFLVIVSASLISLIVASFLRIVIRDGQQASNQDLSQSAYDSAQAGVEDAKRALAIYHQTCADSTKSAQCADMGSELSKDINDQSCRILAEKFGIGDISSNETIIRTGSSGESLDQAYTCVKISTLTDDFEGELREGGSKIIQLKSTDPFNHIKISWHTRVDNNQRNEVSLPSSSNNMLESFSDKSKWSNDRFPSVLRAQIITKGSSYDYSNYIDQDKNHSKTAFLFPSSNTVVDTAFGSTVVRGQSADTRFNFSKDSLSAVRCNRTMTAATYACSAVIKLENDIVASDGAFMKLSSQYGATTNYSVELMDSSANTVRFDGVQPLIDSNGRANDLFRRVHARVEMHQGSLPIPEFAVSTDGQFCKVMIIRDSTKDSTIECK